MPLFDVHTYLTDTALSHAMADPASMRATLRRHGITAAAVISGLAAECDFITGNHHVGQVLNASEGIFGYAVLNTAYPVESLEEQRRHLLRPEFVAGVLFPHDGKPVTLEDAREIVNAQRRYLKPLAISTPDSDAIHAATAIAEAFPNMKFIFLSMGGDDWRTAVAAAKRQINIYLETSGSLDSDKLASATAAITPRKLLFGSSLPFSDPQLMIGLLEEATALTNYDRSRILHQNAEAIFNAQPEG